MTCLLLLKGRHGLAGSRGLVRYAFGCTRSQSSQQMAIQSLRPHHLSSFLPSAPGGSSDFLEFLPRTRVSGGISLPRWVRPGPSRSVTSSWEGDDTLPFPPSALVLGGLQAKPQPELSRVGSWPVMKAEGGCARVLGAACLGAGM